MSHGDPFNLNALSAEQIQARLASPAPNPEAEWPEHALPPRPAAVLLPLFRQNEDWHLLFIRRACNSRDRHSGEVAFPGGAVEAFDTDASDTALRETEEEIGIDRRSVRVLGAMPAYRTSSNYSVTPVVGTVDWPIPLRPDPTEVARVFSIPLEWLGRDDNHAIRPWHSPYRVTYRRVVFFQEYEGERLWGVSARIVLNFLAAVRRNDAG